jgi:protein SYS1
MEGFACELFSYFSLTLTLYTSLGFSWMKQKMDWQGYRTIAIVILIARSKLVPDFALTIHFLHLLFTTLYTRSLPRNAMWWLAMFASSALSVALGMWGCRYRELQPVFFGGGRILGNNPTPSAAAANSGAGGGGGSGEGSRKSIHDDEDGDGNDFDEDHDNEGRRLVGDEELGLGRGGRGRGRERQGEYEMVKMESRK